MLLAAGLVVLPSSVVQAQDHLPSQSGAEAPRYATARLDWERAEGASSCLDGEALRRAVNARWGRQVIGAGAEAEPDLRVEGRMEGRPGRWRARFELFRRDGSSMGSRELSTAAAHCSALDEALALAAGLMLDLSLRKIEEERREALPASDRPPGATDVAASPAPGIRIPADTSAPRAPVRIEGRAGGELELGLLPSVALGARAGLALEVPAGFRAGAAFVAWLPAERRARGAGVAVSAMAAELSACAPVLDGLTVRLHLCAAQRLGRADAEGLDLPRARSTGEPFATAGAMGMATWHLSDALLVGAGVRVDAALVRYRFVYERASGATGVVHEMSPVSGGLVLEAGVRL